VLLLVCNYLILIKLFMQSGSYFNCPQIPWLRICSVHRTIKIGTRTHFKGTFEDGNFVPYNEDILKIECSGVI